MKIFCNSYLRASAAGGTERTHRLKTGIQPTSQLARWWISTKRCFVPPLWTFPMIKKPCSNAHLNIPPRVLMQIYIQDGLQMSYNLGNKNLLSAFKMHLHDKYSQLKTSLLGFWAQSGYTPVAFSKYESAEFQFCVRALQMAWFINEMSCLSGGAVW